MVGRYSPVETATFGFYTAGDTSNRTELIEVVNTRANSQTLFPDFTGTSSFNVAGTFGMYGTRRGNQFFYSEDQFNTNTGVVRAWRIYPLMDRTGMPIADAYLFTLEEASNGDYQDYMYVVFNIRPDAGTLSSGNGIDIEFTTPDNNDTFILGEAIDVTAVITDDN